MQNSNTETNSWDNHKNLLNIFECLNLLLITWNVSNSDISFAVSTDLIQINIGYKTKGKTILLTWHKLSPETFSYMDNDFTKSPVVTRPK